MAIVKPDSQTFFRRISSPVPEMALTLENGRISVSAAQGKIAMKKPYQIELPDK
jgi:hypothetical protein